MTGSDDGSDAGPRGEQQDREGAWHDWADRGLMAYACVGLRALRTVEAVLKSQEIAWRGLLGWQSACNGLAHMMLHDEFADLRTRLSCQSVASAVALERDLLQIAWQRTVVRAAILRRIMFEAAEDASVPLWRRWQTGFGTACCLAPDGHRS